MLHRSPILLWFALAPLIGSMLLTLQEGDDKKKNERKTEVVEKGKEIEYPPTFDKSGHVVVHTGVDYNTMKKNAKNEKDANVRPSRGGISLACTDDCANPCWIQFLWKEHFLGGKPVPPPDDWSLQRHKDDGSAGGKTTTVPYGTGWIVDSASADSPCYNSEAAHSEDGKTIFDAPKVNKSGQGPSDERIVFHYIAYLLCGADVKFRVEWSRTFDRKGGDTAFEEGPISVTSGAKATSLSDAEKAQLKADYPNQQIVK